MAAGYGLSKRKKEGIEIDVWVHVTGISTHILCVSNQTRNRDKPDPNNQTRNGFTIFQKSGMDPTHPGICLDIDIGWLELNWVPIPS
jgi:hypothetical protein